MTCATGSNYFEKYYDSIYIKNSYFGATDGDLLVIGANLFESA